MASASLSTSPTQLDAGSSDNVSITNTGATDVTVTRGAQSYTLKPTQGRVVYPEGTAVTAAAVSGSGSVSYTATAARLSQQAQFAADPAFTGTYAQPKGAWSAGTYAKNSVVTYSGTTYRSLVDGNTATPGSDGTKWETWGGGSLQSVLAAVEGGALYAYGHSFLAGAAGAARRHYATRLASRLSMTLTNRAVGGTRAADAAIAALGNSGTWTVGAKGLVLVQALINDSRLHGNDAVTKNGALQALRALMAVISASARTELDATSGTITFNGTWNQSGAGVGFSNSLIAYTTTQGSYADVVTPAGNAYIMTAGKNNTAGSGPVITVTDQTAGGTTLATLDLSAQISPTPDTPTFVPYAYQVPSGARGHTLRFTKTDAGASSLTMDVLLPQSTTPPPVVMVKDPYLANYAASVSFPNGSDAVTDAFNALISTVQTEFPNILIADPNAGFWDKTTCIWSGDQVHPNDKGAEALAQTVIATLQANAAALLANAGMGNVP